MNQQTKEEQIKEFSRWKNSPEGTGVWTRSITGWDKFSFPDWVNNHYYIVDDMEAEARKIFADGKNIYAEHIKSGKIIEFTALTVGKLIETGANPNSIKVGNIAAGLPSVTNNKIWKMLPNHKPQTKNKQIAKEMVSEEAHNKSSKADILPPKEP